MPLSIKSTTEIVRRTVSNWFKCLPNEVQVRVKEHSRSFLSCPVVHIALELNELINTVDPHLTANSTADEKKKKEKHPKGHTVLY